MTAAWDHAQRRLCIPLTLGAGLAQIRIQNAEDDNKKGAERHRILLRFCPISHVAGFKRGQTGPQRCL